MTDCLTQLQDCLDQLATQFYASIRYIATHHPSSPLNPSQPLIPQTQPTTPPPPPPPTTNPPTTTTNNPPTTNPPLTPQPFPSAQQELAQDLLIKARQIEYLIRVLPGVEKSEEEQEARILVLEGMLREAEEERKGAVGELEGWRGRLEGVLGGVRR